LHVYVYLLSLGFPLCSPFLNSGGGREGAREGDGNDDTPETPIETETERKRKIWRKLRPVGMMTL
jgi:hypothetical protein